MHWSVLLGSLALCSLAVGQMDKYTDENRPYKFGFNIEGHQHRKEEKDEKGIIKGEYGFITADGYYRVTVYETDEDGDFKIISMKNYYVGFPPDDPTTTPSPSPRNYPAAKSSTVQLGAQPKAREFDPTSPTTQAKPLAASTSSPQAAQKATPAIAINGNVACSSCLLPPTTAAPMLTSDRNALLTSKSPLRTPQKTVRPSQAPARSFDTPLRSSQIPARSFNSQSERNADATIRPNIPNEKSGILPIENKSVFPPQDSSANRQGTQGIILATTLPNIMKNSQTDVNKYITEKRVQPIQITEKSKSITSIEQKTINTERPLTKNGVTQKFNTNVRLLDPKSAVNQAPQPILDKGQAISNLGRDTVNTVAAGEDGNDKLLYRFNYTVGFHGHHEDGYRNGDKAGDYFVNTRDGVSRRVEYIANEFGYQPNITRVDLSTSDARVPKKDTEKNYGLQGYEFKWFLRK